MAPFYNFFLNHWERKLISLFLSVILWLFVNHSLTTTKVLDNVAVRLINIPMGLTVEDLQPNGILSKKISLSLQGNKASMGEISSNDIEVVLDALDKSGTWEATISRKNLASLNPDIELSKAIKRIKLQRIPIQLTRLITEKIPLIITQPIGDPPQDYQFLDVWPSHLTLSISGPEEIVKKLKSEGLNLTFNLNDIDRSDLDTHEAKSDEVSFFVPDSWKQISIPALSDRPFAIDDPMVGELRIDFVRNDLHPITKPLPLTIFFPTDYRVSLNPEIYSLAMGSIVKQFHGLYFLQKPLYARGVSKFFLDTVQDMIQISILVAPKNEKKHMDWSVQFINPTVLEEKYVSHLMASEQDRSEKREEYHRLRFRHYMNRFSLFKSNWEKLDLKIELVDNQIVIHENDRNY